MAGRLFLTGRGGDDNAGAIAKTSAAGRQHGEEQQGIIFYFFIF
jgi:hypothetical protein